MEKIMTLEQAASSLDAVRLADKAKNNGFTDSTEIRHPQSQIGGLLAHYVRSVGFLRMQIFFMQVIISQPPVKDWMEYLHLIQIQLRDIYLYLKEQKEYNSHITKNMPIT